MKHSTAIAATASAFAVFVALTACAPSSDLSEGASSERGDEVFTVGVVAPMTSWAGAIGPDLERGWELFWEEHGTQAGAFTVETIWEDDASDPETALTKAGRLVEEEQVDAIVGPVLANNSLAIADYAAQVGVANLSQGGGDDLTQRQTSPFTVRVGASGTAQMTYPAGQWAADQGYKTAATLCVDYAFGWESCGGFVSAFADAGGEVETQLWYPGDAPDLSSYVSQLVNLDVDVIFVGSGGGTDSSNFVRSASDFGLLTKTPIINNCCTTDQAILQDVGDLALGMISTSIFAEGNDDPAIAKFVEDYEAAYGVLPSSYALGMYITGQLLVQVLEDSDTKLTGEELVAAMKSADLTQTLWGEASFDEYGNVVAPVYVREVTRRDDGVLWNTVIDTYPSVSQFWTFGADHVLSNPVFSQDFQQQ